MEVTQRTVPTAPMGPPALSSPNGERSTDQHLQTQHEQQQSINGSSAQPVGAAAAAQQPKVVQTAFIHKLYKYATFAMQVLLYFS